MTNINSSHIFDDFIARRASVGQQQAETPQQETKPEGKKKINKALIGAAAAAGLAAIAFAGISMLRKGKMPEEVQKAVQSAEEFAQDANRTAEDVNKLRDEIEATIKDIEKTVNERLEYAKKNGKEDSFGDVKVFDENGKVLGKFKFKDGKPKSYFEGDEFDFQNGTTKIAKQITFKDGKICIYQEGFYNGDNGQTIAKELSFDDNGKIKSYEEGLKQWQDSHHSYNNTARTLSFKDGKISFYQEGSDAVDDVIKTAKELSFDDNGKIRSYEEGIEYSSLKAAKQFKKNAREIKFEDGKIRSYEEGYESDDDVIKIAKKLEFEDGKPVNYSEGTKFDCETHDRFAQKMFIDDKYGRKKGWKEVKQD